MASCLGNISLIGGGNLSRALISGLRKSDFPQDKIVVSNRGREKLLALAKDFGITAAETNAAAAEQADLLVLAVKPQDLRTAIADIQSVVKEKSPLVISLAAGIGMDILDQWFDCPLSIIRTMPNTATLVGKGVTVLYANPRCSEEQRKTAESLFKLVGVVCWVKSEEELDLMTPFVGSSVAYLYIFIEAMKLAAFKTGVDPAIIHDMALQTIHGAVNLAKLTRGSLEELEAQVATPGGVTEPSLKVLREGGLFSSMEKAFKIVAARCVALRTEAESLSLGRLEPAGKLPKSPASPKVAKL